LLRGVSLFVAAVRALRHIAGKASRGLAPPLGHRRLMLACEPRAFILMRLQRSAIGGLVGGDLGVARGERVGSLLFDRREVRRIFLPEAVDYGVATTS